MQTNINKLIWLFVKNSYYIFTIYFLIYKNMKGIESKKWPDGWMAEIGKGRENLKPNFPWVDRESWFCSKARDKVTFILNIN